MEKEGLIFMRESATGILFAGFIIMGLILFLLASGLAGEENPQQEVAKKLKKKEQQLQQKEERLKQIEQQLKAAR